MNTLRKIHLYYRTQPARDRYLPGDRYIIPFLRKLIRGKKVSGIEKVFLNLCKGFDKLRVKYDINLPFQDVLDNEPVIILGNGRQSLEGYSIPNPIIAGIALMTHPSEWPDLIENFPVVKYLQHSSWANKVYISYYGANHCQEWAAGIDTEKWKPSSSTQKTYDLLIYNKIRWQQEEMDISLRLPILGRLDALGISYTEIIYGSYKEKDYLRLLKASRSMLFLCEHESQGIACCEALSMNVPVIAWDQGYCLDPNRFNWNDPVIPATSVPFFDGRCGATFKNYDEFEAIFDMFWNKVNSGGFSPREYVLENLSLEKSAQGMLKIVKEVYG